MSNLDLFLPRFTVKVDNKFYKANLDAPAITYARNMLLEVMTNAADKRMKRSELGKEILKALKVKKVDGWKSVVEKDVNKLIAQLCIQDPNNKAFFILK